MKRIVILTALFLFLLALTGCGEKPENIVKEYLKKASVYDIAGIKNLCTGEAWKTLDNLAADINVDKVMVDNPNKAEVEGQNYYSKVESKYKVTLQDKTSDSATVLVVSNDAQVTFSLVIDKGTWKIDNISDPTFGLAPVR